MREFSAPNVTTVELTQYGFYIERTAKRIKQYMQRKFTAANFGITVDQWVILDVLNAHDGLSQFEIAEKTYKDAPTVTRIIDLLCKKGFTKREIDGKDRRRFKIFLTPNGRKKIEEVLPIVKECREVGWSELNEADYSQLLRIMDTIFGNFAER
ncbi:MAG: MarR family winged helix-turn-helix transcriptional regulator [Bacteroidota bacterium]